MVRIWPERFEPTNASTGHTMTAIRRFYSFVKGTLSPLFLRDTAPRSLGRVLETQARKRPDQPLFLFEGLSISYRQANEAANRYARLFMSLGYVKGDTVALIMENRPEYLIIHGGLSKVGIIPALINTNNRGQVLVHAITVAGAGAVICGSELIQSYLEIKDEIPQGQLRHVFIEKEGKEDPTPEGVLDLSPLLARQEVTDPVLESPVTLGDTLEYIYTSGTTGHPKATIIKQKKWFQLGYALGGMCMTPVPGEVQYLCLPLYHNSGMNIAWPLTLMWGGTLSIRRRFSARHFWDDIRACRATLFVYVGELCRYLNNAPARDNDGDNPLRTILGNGMRAETWEIFRKRFAIDRIIEVYGATEGVGGLVNRKGVPGMIGRLSLFGVVKMGEVAKYDPEADALVRNKKGFAIRCEPGETGMFLSKISFLNQFAGYRNNPKATRSKLIEDVFRKGDAYFVSGDLFKLHDKDYVSFVDRLGDTFKWKGEVVSTQEVADVVHQFQGIEDANVYGVEVKDAEGRAGMAALTLTPGKPFDFDGLADHVTRNLAVYARPRVIRILESADITSTFKQVKTRLKQEGFDPGIITDPLYFLDPVSGKYVELTRDLYTAIQSGRVRF